MMIVMVTMMMMMMMMMIPLKHIYMSFFKSEFNVVSDWFEVLLVLYLCNFNCFLLLTKLSNLKISLTQQLVETSCLIFELLKLK